MVIRVLQCYVPKAHPYTRAFLMLIVGNTGFDMSMSFSVLYSEFKPALQAAAYRISANDVLIF